MKRALTYESLQLIYQTGLSGMKKTLIELNFVRHVLVTFHSAASYLFCIICEIDPPPPHVTM